MAKSGKAGIAEDEIQAKGEDNIDAGDDKDVEEIFHLALSLIALIVFLSFLVYLIHIHPFKDLLLDDKVISFPFGEMTQEPDRSTVPQGIN